MKTPPFALYPQEQRWWSFNDYGAVLAVMERLQPRRVLEFGPGSSTLALIEGGARQIDCCEDDGDWFDRYRERLELRYPAIVKMRPYVWADPLYVPGLVGERYDLALIDGPRDTTQRPAVIDFCLQRCGAVLVPTEDHDSPSSFLRPVLWALAEKYGRQIEIDETGPLAGGFALLA